MGATGMERRAVPTQRSEASQPLFAGFFELGKGTDAANLSQNGVLGRLIGRLAEANLQLLELRSPCASAGNLAVAFNPSHASFVPCVDSSPVAQKEGATTGSVSCSKTTVHGQLAGVRFTGLFAPASGCGCHTSGVAPTAAGAWSYLNHSGGVLVLKPGLSQAGGLS